MNNIKKTYDVFQHNNDYYHVVDAEKDTFCIAHYATGVIVPKTNYKRACSSKEYFKKLPPYDFSQYPIINSIDDILNKKENERLQKLADRYEAKKLAREECEIKYGTRSEENKKKAEKEIIRLEREWMQMPMNRLTVNAKRCEEIVSRINNLKFV